MVEHYFSVRPKSRPERGLIRCWLGGIEFEFLTASGVFSHKGLDHGTRLLIESMELPKEGSALDLGCGYGPIGVVAAVCRPRLEVWMTDINKRAVVLARQNAQRNGARNARVLEGSLYEPIGDQLFDVILSNPPFSAGLKRAVEPMIEGAPRHLKSGGSLQVVVRSTKGGNNLAKLLALYFGCFEVVARGSGYRVLRAEKR